MSILYTINKHDDEINLYIIMIRCLHVIKVSSHGVNSFDTRFSLQFVVDFGYVFKYW